MQGRQGMVAGEAAAAVNCCAELSGLTGRMLSGVGWNMPASTSKEGG